ncbi:ROK family transcriptional regulator [Streptomyces sp. 7N604]|uniref:ROK family transcriptional regulator n=1 Tax=Streptomyces sp. 7N604 TaxID=3457415 RepID=UPI003FD25348
MTPTRVHPAGRTASPSTARAINDRLALRLLQEEGPLTAGRLKVLTGLSRPTVADLVERLQGAGLIAVVGEAGAERRGPNARLYGIVADRAYLAGVDVRTRGVAVSVADLLGRTLAEASLPVDPAGDKALTVESAAALLERTAAEAGAPELHTVGVGAPGLVDPATGALRVTGTLPAWHGELVAELRRRLGIPVLLENEVNLAAVAEQRLGAARDRDTFALLWLGHGVGAAVVLDGRLRRGASGGTGEIGFLPVPGTGGLPSATGCEGGFHSLTGSAAVCALAREYGLGAAAQGSRGPAAENGAGATPLAGMSVAPGPSSDAAAADVPTASSARSSHAPALERPGGDGADDDASAAAATVRAARAAGERGEAFLDALAARIALGAAAVAAVLDPGCVVLGGETGRAGGDDLARRVGEHLVRLSPLPTEVRAGTVGGGGVLRGAVVTAMDAAQDALFTTGGR